MVHTKQTLKTGDLAYLDTFAGMLPCRVLSVVGQSGPCGSMQQVRVRLTTNHGPYKRGEVLSEWGLRVVPRRAIRGSRYDPRILPYDVQCDS